jgi:orotate phosphoribosyltransferase
MTFEPLTVEGEGLRNELAADLGRGGYVLSATDPAKDGLYFDKALVFSRPGLMSRAAKLMSEMLPPACERIAVTGVPSAALGTALSLATGVPLLFGRFGEGGEIRFDGEMYRGVKAVLLEDVVFTGESACHGARGLDQLGADVLGVICLLDRDIGGAQRISETGFNLKALFHEEELVTGSRGTES